MHFDPPNKQRGEFKKLVCDLGNDTWHGYATETVWAEQVSDDRYRVMNTPFFVSGVSFLDVVFARNVDDKLYLKSASIRGGHSTYRIILNASAAEKDFQQRWRQLQSLGCTYESADLGYRLYAIDVIPTADINRVYTLLEIGVSDGVWDFEEGHCAHTPGAT